MASLSAYDVTVERARPRTIAAVHARLAPGRVPAEGEPPRTDVCYLLRAADSV